jgi:hypothetical protein
MSIILNKRNFKTISIIIIIDILTTGGWALYFKPSSDMTIALLFFIPAIFLINLVIASILYFIKRYYTPFFMINAFISAFMMYFFFGWYIDIDRKIHYESWDFSIDNVNYYISYPQNCDTAYWITYSTEPGWSHGGKNYRGNVCVRNDTVYFTSIDSCRYYIYRDTLYNFENIEKVKVRKKY